MKGWPTTMDTMTTGIGPAAEPVGTRERMTQ